MPGRTPSIDDMAILGRLARAYRLTTASLEAEVLEVSSIAAKRRLDRMVDAGFLKKQTVNVRVSPPGLSPVLTWNVHDAAPDFGALSYLLCKRWDDLVPHFEHTYSIAPKSLALLAMPKRKSYVTGQASHDLGVFRMWQWAKQNCPKYEFVGEDVFAPDRGNGEIIEDAQLHVNGKPIALMEFGGAYRVERLREIHDSISTTQIPYILF